MVNTSWCLSSQQSFDWFGVIRACRAVVRLLPDEGGCFVGEN